MPTLAGILGVLLQVYATIKEVGQRLGVNFAAIAQSLRDLSWYMKYTLFPGINAALLEAVASIIESMQGDGTDPPVTLPTIYTTVNNIYSGQEVDHDLLVHIGIQADFLKELVARISPAWYVAQWDSGYTHYGTSIEVSASGTYTIEASDGLLIEVLSVPVSQGMEMAGGFARYPHLGWILGSLPQWPEPAWTDLVYLGPQSQGFSWPGARDVVSVTVFLKPGSTIRITPWKNVLGD
jgi:hypothetical protein